MSPGVQNPLKRVFGGRYGAFFSKVAEPALFRATVLFDEALRLDPLHGCMRIE